MKDNRTYYDDFANWYENERHHGYHALIDRLQLEVVLPLCQNADVLELGCGTGLILNEINSTARSAIGLDISPKMLERARERGLDVVEGKATELPFEDESFDVVYSFKVLAHVESIHDALAEVARVLRPGGHAVLDFYNRHSLRYLIKRLKTPDAVSQVTTDDEVYPRYDSLADVRRYLPSNLHLQGIRGVRTFTPFAQVHDMPILGRLWGQAERFARDQAWLSKWGGFMLVVVRRS